MSFVPHTPEDRAEMLAALGLSSIDELFDTIPESLRVGSLDSTRVPGPLSEIEIVQYMSELASRNEAARMICFAGGGVYDEYIPAAVSELASRPEFKTSYTPYQPEVSQGVLQALFEYQSLICRLTGMEVANASVYDGGSAVVEAANMAAAITGRQHFIVSKGVNPRFRYVLETFARGSGHSLHLAPLQEGMTDPTQLGESLAERRDGSKSEEVAAVIIQHPNYLGVLEEVDLVVEAAHDLGALCVVVTDPIANGVLRRPGDYGVDIVVAEGQSLGNPMFYGGPYLGIVASKEQYLRHLPGRISGMTVDADGRQSFALALQGREQHIRREKASSNICTNQTLNAIAAAIHLCWLGPVGLSKTATRACVLAHELARGLSALDGFAIATERPFLREFPLQLPLGAPQFLDEMAKEGILAGIPLGDDYPEYENTVLIGVSSARTIEEVEKFIRAANRVGK
jgi:glycine dehydrogenase subunit 1